MGQVVFTLVVRDEDVKIRKRFAPRTRVVPSKKLYNRKHLKEKGGDLTQVAAFLFQAPAGRNQGGRLISPIFRLSD